MTVIAHLNLTEDPAVVQMMYDYGEDAVPDYMAPPDYVDVTDQDPLPQPGFTYDGTDWKPGVPQQQAKVREVVADTTEQFVAANRVFLEIAEPTGEQIEDQVVSLTRQVVHLQQLGLDQYGRDQDWSEFHVELPIAPIISEEPPEDEPLVAAFAATPDSPHTGDPVQFDATASTGTITRYDWDFGDSKGEAQDGGPTPVYTYDKKGKRTVTLLITDENGETDEAELAIQIT